MSEVLSKTGLYKLLGLLGKKSREYPIMYHNSGSLEVDILKKYNGGTILVESLDSNYTTLDFSKGSEYLMGDWTIAKVGDVPNNSYFNEWEIELIFPGEQKRLLDGHQGSYAKVFTNIGGVAYNIHNIYDNVGHILYCSRSDLKPITKGGKEMLVGITSDYTFEKNGNPYPVSSIMQGLGRDGNEKFFGAYYYGEVPSNGDYHGNSDILCMVNKFDVDTEGDILAGYAYPLYMIFSKDSYLDLGSEDLIVYKLEGENRWFEGRILLQNLKSLQGYKIYFLCEVNLSLYSHIGLGENYSGSYRIILVKP